MSTCLKTLAGFGLLLLVLVALGCSDNGQDDLVDGDSQPDGDVDAVDGDDEPVDGDAPDGDAPDGDVDGDSEGDGDDDEDADGPFVPPIIECDAPAEIWDGNWRAASAAIEEGAFNQRESRLFDNATLNGAIRSVAVYRDDAVFAVVGQGLATINAAGETQALANWPQVDYTQVLYKADAATPLVALAGQTAYVATLDAAPTDYDLGHPLAFARWSDDRLILVDDDDSFGVFDIAATSVTWFGALATGVNDIADGGDSAWVATQNGVYIVNWQTGVGADWEHNDLLPDLHVTGITPPPTADGCPQYITTEAGLLVVTQDGTEVFDADNPLPYLNLKGVTVGPNCEALLLSDKGLIVRQLDGKIDYYHTKYWVPSWDILDATVGANGDLFAATAEGLGIVSPLMLTLAEKAAILDTGMAERHNRWGMFSPCNLATPGDLSSSYTRDDDNDGQWTGMYLASQIFRYLVTQSPDARDLARQAKDALLLLHEVTGKPGFFARSVIPPEDCESRQCENCGEWHLSEDNKYCWKGDTSSDEYVGHMFGLSLYYDYLADDTEKAEIRDAFVKLHDGMIAHGYILEDIDGQCTTHGQFSPSWMEMIGVFGDAGLNGAMILGGLRATYDMSGEERFLKAFYELAIDHGYAEYVSQIEHINLRVHTNHDAEEMSFLAMSTLIRYETDPCLMAMWQQGLDYLWEMNSDEHNNEFAILYAWMSHNMENVDWPVMHDTFRQWYTHGIGWAVTNSHRADIVIDEDLDRFDREQSVEVLPFDQQKTLRWAENPFRLDHTGGGTGEELLTPYLLPYWLGRYLEVVGAPAK